MKSCFFSSLVLITSIFSVPSGCPEIKLPRIPCEPCQTEIIPPPCICAYNTPARFDARGCFGISVWGSYLYWTAKLDGSELGISTAVRPDVGTNIPIQGGKIVDFDCQYKSGFKVGVSLLYDFDHWELEVEYLNYHNTFVKDKEAFICPKWLSPRIVAFQSRAPIGAEASWKVGYDQFNILFARNYYVGKKLTLKPAFGIEAIFLKQDLNIDYLFPIQIGPGLLDRNYISENHINANCWGTKAGIESNWIFGQTFRVVGALAGSIVYTDYDVSTNQFLKRLPDLLPTQVDDDICTLRPHFEMRFGLAYGDYFCCDRFFVDIGAFYEFHVLWNQNMFILLYDADCPRALQTGDLYFHGLTATLKIAF